MVEVVVEVVIIRKVAELEFGNLPDDDYLDDDLDHEEGGSEDSTNRGAVLSALLWCLVPIIGFVCWALLTASGAASGCGTSDGQPCASPTVVAWSGLRSAAPLIGSTLGLSIALALILKRVAGGWRSATIGFASAVVGAGIVTVFWTTLANS